MTTKQVIFLGAGASKCEGAPLQTELLPKGLNLLKKAEYAYDQWSQYHNSKTIITTLNPRDFNKKAKNAANRFEEEKPFSFLPQYFEFVWNLKFNVTPVEKPSTLFPTFEELLGTIDIARLKKENLKFFNLKDLDDIRSALIYLISEVIRTEIGHKIVQHKKLVKQLKEEGELYNTTFITTNYDLIMDEVLRAEAKVDIDYGFPFSLPEKWKKFWRPPRKEFQVKLLKIHGSLNWYYCNTCNHIIHGGYGLFKKNKKEQEVIKQYTSESKQDYRRKCPYCKEIPLTPLIIPPTLYKEMTNPFLQQVQIAVERAFHETERIIFCGYSFPDADMHVKYMIKKAELLRWADVDLLVPRRKLRVFIVNNHPKKKPPQKEEEEKRFKRFFYDYPYVYYTSLSFEEFCKGVLTEKVLIRKYVVDHIINPALKKSEKSIRLYITGIHEHFGYHPSNKKYPIIIQALESKEFTKLPKIHAIERVTSEELREDEIDYLQPKIEWEITLKP
ncbi:MAG: SIR2 family protein [Candidatus Hodarchaeales archaeon]|jgi:NAD-dependent SIR2 family protein deacetylase